MQIFRQKVLQHPVGLWVLVSQINGLFGSMDAALMVAGTALFRNPNYHKASDLAATIDFNRFARVTYGLAQVVIDLSNGNEK